MNPGFISTITLAVRQRVLRNKKSSPTRKAGPGRKSQSLRDLDLGAAAVTSEGGVFVSVHSLPTEYDHNLSDSDSDSSVVHTPTNSPPTSWKTTATKSFFNRAPLIVNDPEKSDEPIKDEAQALGLVMARSRHLPGTWYYSSNHVLVNQERTKRTVAPLVRLRELDEIAREQADAMAKENKMFHSSPDYLSMRFGRPARRLGENVAKGGTIRALHKAMMENRADRNNLLDRRYTHMGMATARAKDGELYICQIFRG